MINKYKLSGPVQKSGFKAYTLHEWVDGIFNSYRAEPTATIHVLDVLDVRLGGYAYIIVDGVPIGLKAANFDHALGFLKSILSITDLDHQP